MQNISQTILEYFISGLITVIGGILGVVAKKGLDYFKTKFKNENFNNALNLLDELIATNIVAVENTLKPQILKAIADGKVDKTELQKLSKTVQKSVTTQLSSNASTTLNEMIGDPDSFIKNRIEKILEDLKNQPDNAVERTVIEENTESSNTTEAVISNETIAETTNTERVFPQ